ncbi:MAG: argininosuccinate lyase [Chlamydiae bacterium]|nr:argininosuccinate lyase [Chlamydiota bacterium]MBI3277667.1 argininosuccinate lyase [Chlamydiota bacterium]
MWGGRFQSGTHPLMEKLSASVHFDCRLASYDITGSIAHAKMLERSKVITRKECDLIFQGLKEILNLIERNQFRWDEKLEDVHTHIECALRKKIGDVADKLHTARSRNDQVVLDLKLYLRDEMDKFKKLICSLQSAFLSLAKSQGELVIPGYTHLQRAQPVLLAHHLLAYVEMLERDQTRLEDANLRMDVLPLGSCALAGTSFETDRAFLARELDFSKISENSMDAVSDRDFVIEVASVLAILGVHLSRFSEEMILWSSFEFGFVELPDAFTTGSSAMPQKKNPDAFELARGKTGRLIGNLSSLLVLLKGLPLTYNRDLQEDKEAIFDSIDQLQLILEIFIELVPQIRFCPEALAEKEDFTSSLDLAEYLVKKGIPFRQAHKIVGEMVRYCLDQKKGFQDLSLEEIRKFSKAFDQNFKNLLGWQASVHAKKSLGSTNPIEVKKQLEKWNRTLGRTHKTRTVA